MSTSLAWIELRDLYLDVRLGTYGPKDVVPSAHILDLTLAISPVLVQVSTNDMAPVFDYDPLIAQIHGIAASQHYETQEYLITLITQACAQYKQIVALDISLRKHPVLRNTGSFGVRLQLGEGDLLVLRQQNSLHK
jgi:dihydroneopterin aldolase